MTIDTAGLVESPRSEHRAHDSSIEIDPSTLGQDSIFRDALGETAWERLHPMVRRRFGFRSGDGVGFIGEGVMDEVWRGGPHTVPFLWMGTRRNILFPEVGRGFPFTIRNYAYLDSFGRETWTVLRTFQTHAGPRKFDAYMVPGRERGRILDYLGTHQHLAVDLDLSVDEHGGLVIRSGEQRFYEGPLGFRYPSLFAGAAEVRERFCEETGMFHIRVEVRNRVWGRLFGYHGRFRPRWFAVDAVPADAYPVREERRE